MSELAKNRLKLVTFVTLVMIKYRTKLCCPTFGFVLDIGIRSWKRYLKFYVPV